MKELMNTWEEKSQVVVPVPPATNNPNDLATSKKINIRPAIKKKKKKKKKKKAYARNASKLKTIKEEDPDAENEIMEVEMSAVAQK